MTRRIFLDSSVIIAGAISTRGSAHIVIRLGEIGLFTVVVSTTVLNESQNNIQRKTPQSMPYFVEILLSIQPEILPDPAPEESLIWETIIEKKDAPILAAAVNGKVDRLLSWNTKHFTAEVGKAAGILIQTPAEFVQDVRRVLTVGL